ncbi:hypothetical protein Sango_1734500 [Sesamum angolense]|uniref:BSD domain-containing protein n=1 Tax=Sesamum angolense TaxID=2727404 RepID=A0AAE1WMF3_9LAMI|nr:hypothetical protein Sango_1734500 [Sesamum angolense]
MKKLDLLKEDANVLLFVMDSKEFNLTDRKKHKCQNGKQFEYVYHQKKTERDFEDASFAWSYDSEVSDIPAVSNVRQDLTEWQEKHAKLVLSTVKVSIIRDTKKVSQLRQPDEGDNVGGKRSNEESGLVLSNILSMAQFYFLPEIEVVVIDEWTVSAGWVFVNSAYMGGNGDDCDSGYSSNDAVDVLVLLANCNRLGKIWGDDYNIMLLYFMEAVIVALVPVMFFIVEISKLRYQLCPRVMKERKFWRIYFILVNSHVAPYEKRYTEDVKLKAEEKVEDTAVKEDSSSSEKSSKTADETSKQKSNNVKSATSEQDLDVFLLGDLEDGDDGPDDDGDDGLDDDFDKI